MSVVTNNPLVKGASGALGRTVVYKQWRGRVVMANLPKKRKSSSEKQKDQQMRFHYAVKFAKRATANPQWKAMYEKGIGGNKFSANAVALSDFLNPPKIEEINVMNYTGAPGEIIRVRAWDDFKVASVTITIMRDNTVIEKGKAQPRGKKGLWRMATSVRNASAPGTVFEVVAKDMAGNETKKAVTIPLAGMQAIPVEVVQKAPRLSAQEVIRTTLAQAGVGSLSTPLSKQVPVSADGEDGLSKDHNTSPQDVGDRTSDKMFTISQIKEAHSKVKSGADFPAFVEDIKQFGVTYFETFVSDGHTEYHGANDYKVLSPENYDAVPVTNVSDATQFKVELKEHQQGKSDYPTFCRVAASLGVEKWAVSIIKMTCTYYDRAGEAMLVEGIPGPGDRDREHNA